MTSKEDKTGSAQAATLPDNNTAQKSIPSLIEVTIPNLDVGIDGSDSKCLEDILNTSAIDSIGYLPRHLVVMGDYTDDDRAYIINEAIRCITEVNNHNSM